MQVFEGRATDDPRVLREFVTGAPSRPAFGQVLMVDPGRFQVEHTINPHMVGMIGAVDSHEAHREWNAIRSTYERLGFPVSVAPAIEGYPDAVFAANQLLPFTTASGDRGAVLSEMTHVERQGEVPHLAAHATSLGLRTLALEAPRRIEGTGDGVWHPDRSLLWGGWGFRTEREAWDDVAKWIGARVVPLHLVDARMYHLDVALMPIDVGTAFSFRGAFDEESWARVQAGFERVIEVDAAEALGGFALNGHCPDGKHLLLPAGNPKTRAQAEAIGLEVVELSTREFQKSGGSIFCLKNMLP